MSRNFLRHYYDVFMLLKRKDVISFIGTSEYLEHKKKRFSQKDEQVISQNEAFTMSDKSIFDFYSQKHDENAPLYYSGKSPSFKEIIDEIRKYIDKL